MIDNFDASGIRHPASGIRHPGSGAGQREKKRRPRPVAAFKLELSTLSAREATGYREAEAESWSTDCVFGAVKRSEDVASLAAWDPGSIVRYFDP